ncbi:MAG: hypothetical protein FJY17_00650 [Bacteroidetes bacterium]|nr:hypothetical protein [Bacteroidota bacterium]
MTRTEIITLTVFNPETEEYEKVRAKVVFTSCCAYNEYEYLTEYDWRIIWIEGSEWANEQIVDKAIETDFDIKSVFYDDFDDYTGED